MARKRSQKPKTPFSLRLEQIRLQFGRVTRGDDDFSQEEFATALVMLPETYRRYERSETEPNLATLAKIKRITGCSLDFLVGGEFDHIRPASGSVQKQNKAKVGANKRSVPRRKIA